MASFPIPEANDPKGTSDHAAVGRHRNSSWRVFRQRAFRTSLLQIPNTETAVDMRHDGLSVVVGICYAVHIFIIGRREQGTNALTVHQIPFLYTSPLISGQHTFPVRRDGESSESIVGKCVTNNGL